MLVYEKWVTENDALVRHLYGTEANIPGDNDNQLVYQDEYGDAITLTNALANTYLDNGNGGIDMVTPQGEESFLAVAIKKQDNSLVNIIPGGNYTPEEKTVTKIEEDSSSTMKTTYSVGDDLSVAGLKIKVTYNNDSTEVIASNASGLSYSPTNGTKLTAENTKLTVTYHEKTCDIALIVS